MTNTAQTTETLRGLPITAGEDYDFHDELSSALDRLLPLGGAHYTHPFTPDEYGDCTTCDGGKRWEHDA